uniref:PIF1/LRR1 pleckstrin homology domain-containing protein n=1 Tax=Sinocyclocheilus rhinocerous TaxID=307959 RepID=A0A673JCZ3_9TELE
MKLQCDVEVVSRLLPSIGVRSKGRSSRAVLSIGRLSDRGVCLLICTARDRSGATKAGHRGATIMYSMENLVFEPYTA